MHNKREDINVFVFSCYAVAAMPAWLLQLKKRKTTAN